MKCHFTSVFPSLQLSFYCNTLKHFFLKWTCHRCVGHQSIELLPLQPAHQGLLCRSVAEGRSCCRHISTFSLWKEPHYFPHGPSMCSQICSLLSGGPSSHACLNKAGMAACDHQGALRHHTQESSFVECFFFFFFNACSFEHLRWRINVVIILIMMIMSPW